MIETKYINWYYPPSHFNLVIVTIWSMFQILHLFSIYNVCVLLTFTFGMHYFFLYCFIANFCISAVYLSFEVQLKGLFILFVCLFHVIGYVLCSCVGSNQLAQYNLTFFMPFNFLRFVLIYCY